MPISSIMSDAGAAELDLLAILEEQNRALLTDVKAVACLPNRPRENSVCSSQSTSSYVEEEYENGQRKSSSELSDYPNATDPPLAPFEHPDSLSKEWSGVIANWNCYVKKRAYIPDLVHKGLPDKFRPIVWLLYTRAHSSQVKDLYDGYQEVKSPSEKAIRRDISRTFPSHDLFKVENGYGQTCLYRLMKAYSNHDREVGYCQGSGFIAGLLLMQLPEIDAFALFTHLMSDYHLRELYKPTMLHLGVCMYQLEHLLADHLPELKEHFAVNSFPPSLYASAWFLTLFSTILSVPVATRVMDLFIVDGINFIFRMALAILKFSSGFLLHADMESMIVFLQRDGPKLWNRHASVIVQMAASFKLNQRKMDKLKKEYLTLRSQDREDQIELRRLRTENGLLLQRIARLEEECRTVAHRLIQSQLVHAQDSELLITLRCELSRLRRRSCQESEATTSPADEHVIDQGNKVIRLGKASVDGDGCAAPNDGLDSDSVFDAGQSAGTKTHQSGHNVPEEGILPTGVCSLPTAGEAGSSNGDTEPDGMGSVWGERQRVETELSLSRHREAEAMTELIQARHQCQHLEAALASERANATEQVSTLKSELLTVKLRETDALSRLEYLKKQLEEVWNLWQSQQRKLSSSSNSSSSSTTSTSTANTMPSSMASKISPLARFLGGGTSAGLQSSPANDELLVVQGVARLPERLVSLKVAEKMAALEHEVTELNLQQEVSTQKVDRLNQRIADLLEQQSSATRREDELRRDLTARTRMCAEIESKCKSNGLMWRSHELMLRSKLTEYRQSLAELEHKYQSLLTTQCLQASSRCDVDDSAGSSTPRQNGEVRLDRDFWQDVPSSMMTDSIGPLDELRLVVDQTAEGSPAV